MANCLIHSSVSDILDSLDSSIATNLYLECLNFHLLDRTNLPAGYRVAETIEINALEFRISLFRKQSLAVFITHYTGDNYLFYALTITDMDEHLPDHVVDDAQNAFHDITEMDNTKHFVL